METTNLSEHTGLTLPELMAELLDDFEGELSAADVIVIGIAHNSIAMNAEKPCGATFDESTYRRLRTGRSSTGTARRRPPRSRFGRCSTSCSPRSSRGGPGKPTIIRTINKYNDWIGWQPANLTRGQQRRTTLQHDVWNDMLCEVAEAHDVMCADIYHAFNGPDGSTSVSRHELDRDRPSR